MFLENSESIATQVGTLFDTHASTSPICIAVAFWGRGAEVLFSSGRVAFRIVCNLRSGGTNPEVIRRLRRMENVDVKQLDGLHAKVVISDGGAVVSSANFSTNGLGLEGPGSSTWLEAGVFVTSSSSTYQAVAQWFSQTWAQSRSIDDSDLIEAEEAWARRNAATRPTSATSNMLDVQTVHFEGRIKPRQRNLRSAAAIVALNGQEGEPMLQSAFAFLFSGGRGRQAFENHHDKFEILGGFVRLRPSFVGYFVGTDGTMESCTDSKRRKSADSALIEQTAAWMLRRAPRPPALEGMVESASFQRVLSQ